MAVVLTLLLLLTSSGILTDDSLTEDTELVFAFMVHRHGDRTLLPDTLSLIRASVDAEVVEELIKPWGYGQLTNVGKQRAYNLGGFIRRRYNELLSKIYNRSEIYIRSTDSTRAKMTILTASAALYPAVGDTWSKRIDWVPTPYTTVPPLLDFNLAQLNCPVYASYYFSTFFSSQPTMSDQYADLLEKLSVLLYFNAQKFPVLSYAIYDAFIALINMGYHLGDDILSLIPELKDAADYATQIFMGNDTYLAHQSGPLLGEFFKYAEEVIAGNETPRVRIYSAHDTNVYSLQAITQVANRQGVPNFASLYSLELRRDVHTGNYVVLPVYLATPEEPEIYLQIEGCGEICDYDMFYNLTSKYILTEGEWRNLCGFNPNMTINTLDID